MEKPKNAKRIRNGLEAPTFDSDEKTNYRAAKEILESANPEDLSYDAYSVSHATLAVADELRELNETLRSFGKGEMEGGRSLQVTSRIKP